MQNKKSILGLACRYTFFSSSKFAFMREYIATPAMAIAVPIPVCVEILLPVRFGEALANNYLVLLPSSRETYVVGMKNCSNLK